VSLAQAIEEFAGVIVGQWRNQVRCRKSAGTARQQEGSKNCPWFHAPKEAAAAPAAGHPLPGAAGRLETRSAP